MIANFAGHRLDQEATGLVACVIDAVVRAARSASLRFEPGELFQNAGRLA